MSNILHKGVVLTSIDVEPHPTDEKKVIFSSKIDGWNESDDAVFMKMVTESTDNNGEPCLEAEKINAEEAKTLLEEKEDKPLFTIHGYNVLPKGYLESMAALESEENANKFSKFNLVPVLWPSKGMMLREVTSGYNEDRESSKLAGENLKDLKNLKSTIDGFPNKSLVCHSMGNRVLRHAAACEFEFDNIFMVAADVRHDIFWKEYIDSAEEDKENEAYDGMMIYNMLTKKNDGTPKGKIYVLHNHRDYALGGSSNVKHWKTRLGQVGPYKKKYFSGWYEEKDLIHEKLRGYVVAEDCYPKLGWLELAAHSYQFSDFAIKFYEDNQVVN